MNKTAVILSNTGTPDDTSVASVRRYLKEFLGDGRVITMPALLRKLLVNGIIVPFRAPKSARLYQKVWTEKGSPLLYHAESLKDKIQNLLGDDYEVMLGMRYGNPSLKAALQTVQDKAFPKVILLPLFPQYASSTSGSISSLAHKEISQWNNIPGLSVIPQFYTHPGYIKLVANNIREMNPQHYDHILFSYHGLPLRHVYATHKNASCDSLGCKKEVNEQNAFCYQATCYATTRLLVQELNIAPEKYTVCFQSRFAHSWLSPFTDDVLVEKAKGGAKRVLIASPAFVTDCLETIVELGVEYKQLFIQNGGNTLDWVPSLNDSNEWAKVLVQMIKNT